MNHTLHLPTRKMRLGRCGDKNEENMEKINIAELLKDCPKGMELHCAMYDNVQFDTVQDGNAYPIEINTPDGRLSLSKYGCYSFNPQCKCVIFPKGKTTWEGFQRPAKDGDVVVCEQQKKIVQMFIVQSEQKEGRGKCYFGYDFEDDDFLGEDIWEWDRLATEEEKQKLFDAIKANGYKWNPETKTLEKLPMYKEGENDTYKQAFQTFGCQHQRMMCMEECAELIDALAKYDRGRNDSADVITELADVSIMVEQMAEFFGREAYGAERERKMMRLREIIEREKK